MKCQMKLSIATLGCPGWTFEEVLTRFEAYGVAGIEVRGLEGEMNAEKIVRFFPENAEETLKRVEEHHLKLVGFGTSCSFHDPNGYEASVLQGKTALMCVTGWVSPS